MTLRIWLACLFLCLLSACKEKAAGDLDGLAGGTLVASEGFDGGQIDPEKWNDTQGGGGWSVSQGWLKARGVKNKALWFREALPAKVRVEFDVRSGSPEGDIKVEIFGDGSRHESGYILIFGGWSNSINTIARLDEHGRDRVEASPQVKVERGRVYKMAVVRTDSTVRWYLDRDEKTVLLSYSDASPLFGAGHEHFAFNDWAVPLYFDNFKVFDLR